MFDAFFNIPELNGVHDGAEVISKGSTKDFRIKELMKYLEKISFIIILVFSLIILAEIPSRAESAKAQKNGFAKPFRIFYLFFAERTDLRLGYLEEWDAEERKN